MVQTEVESVATSCWQSSGSDSSHQSLVPTDSRFSRSHLQENRPHTTATQAPTPALSTREPSRRRRRPHTHRESRGTQRLSFGIALSERGVHGSCFNNMSQDTSTRELDGWLHKLAKPKRTSGTPAPPMWQRRWFTLLGDTLSFYNTDQDAAQSLPPKWTLLESSKDSARMCSGWYPFVPCRWTCVTP